MPEQQQSTNQILRYGINQETGSPKETEKALIHINALAKMGILKFVRIGGTVFTISRLTMAGKWLPATEAELHMYTSEGLQEIMQRMAVLPNTLRNMGVKKASTIVMEPAMLRVLQMGLQRAGLQHSVNTRMQYTGSEMEPAYVVEATL